MSKNELELIDLIRENDDPERALIDAVKVITGYLRQMEVEKHLLDILVQSF